MVLDALSRLQADLPPAEKAEILDCLYGRTTPLSAAERDAFLPKTFAYYGTLVEMKDEFKQRLTEAYTNNKHWKQALEILKDN